MIESLSLIAPGTKPPTRGHTLVLLDGQWYAEKLFEKSAQQVVAHDGVETIEREGRRGFMLCQPAQNDLSRIESCEARLLLFVTTDTDVKTLAPVASRCSDVLFLVHSTVDNSGYEALNVEGFDWKPYHSREIKAYEADLALVTNDWGHERRGFLHACRAQGLPSICLQEATNVDFDGPPYRMRWADIALIQGPHALRYLQREVSFLAGNPRFDQFEPAPMPPTPMVLINCNFIFGLSYLDRARDWLEQCVRAATNNGFRYAITVHPRDETDLTGFDHVMPSGAYRVRDQLEQCTVLVSRDSSLPYEALLLNRHAIYYDPFGEKELTLREDDTGLIEKCFSYEELTTCLGSVSQKPAPADTPDVLHDAQQYLFTSCTNDSYTRVIRALHTIAGAPDLYKTSDAHKASLLSIKFDVILHVWLRPRIRTFSGLRSIWRAGKALKLKIFGR